MSVPVESVSINQGSDGTGISVSSGKVYGDIDHARVRFSGSFSGSSLIELCHTAVSMSADMSTMPSLFFL